MKYSTLEKVLIDKITPAIQDVTPGVQVKAYQSGRQVCDISVGETYPYYDLASLTKIIFSQQKMMHEFDQGHWNFKTKVKDICPDFFDSNILLKDLLTHTAGFLWWKPFYKDLLSDPLNHQTSLDQPLTWENQREKFWPMLNQMSSMTEEFKTNPGQSKSVYSDLDMFVLGFVLERMLGQNILQTWDQVKEDFYPHSTLHFNVNNIPVYNRSQYAPTEPCSYRGRTIRGEVHDENTWALGGVSNHAGLFGSADDVATYGLVMRSQILGIAKYKIRQKTAQMFAERALPVEKGDWALGYMMPTPEVASCGNLFSVHSIGHTGFTGTSLWYDPRRDLLVIILSNRLNYGRENARYVKIRPLIHNWVYEAAERNLSV